MLHEPVQRIRTRTDYLHDVARNWAEWVGRAAELQFSKDFDGCDHDCIDKRSRVAKTRGRRKAVRRTDDAGIFSETH